MRSLKGQMALLAMGGAVILSASLILAFFFFVRPNVLMAEETKARNDLAIAEAIIDLKYPGSWAIRGTELYKGQVCINNNYIAVDYIKNLTGDECEIYANNICASTTLRAGECDRSVGAYAPHEVISKVLERGQYYVGQAEVAGKFYQTAYKPITNEGNQIIGVIYVGAPRIFHNAILYDSLKVMGLAGLILTSLIGLITWFFVGRTIVEPLQEVVKKAREAGMTGQPLKIQSSNEIGELSRAYNQMLAGRQKITNLPKVNEAPQQIVRGVESPPKQQQAPGCNVEDESEWLDALFDSQKELPKGLNRLTLKQIALFLKQQEGNDVTIQDVSEAVCLSKVTVRHYFNYLDEIGMLEIEQKYGSVGRPLRFFKLKA